MMPETNWGSSSAVTPTGNVFVYEALCGGSGIGNEDALPGSLMREGAAMLQALIDDFGQLPGWQVWTMLDRRPGIELDVNTEQVSHVREVLTQRGHRAAFQDLVKQADAVLVVAPETDHLLLRLTRQVEDAGSNLLGPCSEWVAIAADKLRLNHHLAAQGIPVPRCLAPPLSAGVVAGLEPPLVRKPRFGAGAEGLERIPDWESWCRSDLANPLVESYQEGLAVSVSALLGADDPRLLPAGLQHVDLEQGIYQGGAIPLESCLSQRAASLARRALRAMPRSRGFVGVDMVLGDNPAGDDDVVIEINPRVTTSYVGLRVATGVNLAPALLDPFLPLDMPDVLQRVEFTASGQITTVTTTSS